MGIPIIQEIWDGLRWIIDFFIDKVPKPLKVIIFLLFLLLFGSLVSFFMQLSGIHCNSSKDVVKVSTLDIGTNLAIGWETSKEVFDSDNLTICEVHPEKCGNENDCYFYAKQLDTGFYEECNTTNSSDCKYYLKNGACHNCTQPDKFFSQTFYFFIPDSYHPCVSNAYPLDEFTAYLRYFRGCGSSCYVPDHYLWNQSTGQYECADSQYCGATATLEANPIIDQKLNKAGAELVYSISEGSRSYMRMVYIKCNNNFNPRLTFFGLDLLDYKIWLFMIVIYVLVVILIQIKPK